MTNKNNRGVSTNIGTNERDMRIRIMCGAEPARDIDMGPVAQLCDEMATGGHIEAQSGGYSSFVAEVINRRRVNLGGKKTDARCFVIRIKDEIYGFSILVDWGDPKFIELLVLGVQTRFRRQGHGWALLMTAEEQAHNCQKNLKVRCYPASSQMKSMLKKRGYERIHPECTTAVEVYGWLHIKP
ncbi:MAG: GNAT family N-acetyltransferase [Acidithiobacillus sp.]|nr:GNAT family N-acetyltransferase [Acidithiobacillus sp.]